MSFTTRFTIARVQSVQKISHTHFPHLSYMGYLVGVWSKHHLTRARFSPAVSAKRLNRCSPSRMTPSRSLMCCTTVTSHQQFQGVKRGPACNYQPSLAWSHSPSHDSSLPSLHFFPQSVLPFSVHPSQFVVCLQFFSMIGYAFSETVCCSHVVLLMLS